MRDGSFCTNACRKRELRARHRRARVHICVGCGKAFNNRRRDTRFCSAACKQAAYRLRLEAAEEEASDCARLRDACGKERPQYRENALAGGLRKVPARRLRGWRRSLVRQQQVINQIVNRGSMERSTSQSTNQAAEIANSANRYCTASFSSVRLSDAFSVFRRGPAAAGRPLHGAKMTPDRIASGGQSHEGAGCRRVAVRIVGTVCARRELTCGPPTEECIGTRLVGGLT